MSCRYSISPKHFLTYSCTLFPPSLPCTFLTLLFLFTIPRLSVLVVRTALLLSSLSHRYDLVLAVLKHPAHFDLALLEKQQQHTLAQQQINSASSTSGSSTSAGISGGGTVGVPLSTHHEQSHTMTVTTDPNNDDEVITAAMVRDDEGYRHFHKVTRAEAIRILTGKPQGSFLVRPHDTPTTPSHGDGGGSSSDQQQPSQQPSQQQLYFLSFVDKVADPKTTSSSSSATEGGGTIIKHAVVRKDFLSPSDPPMAHELILAQGQGLGLAPGQGAIPSTTSNLISEMFQPLSSPSSPLPQRYAYRCGKVGP